MNEDESWCGKINEYKNICIGKKRQCSSETHLFKKCIHRHSLLHMHTPTTHCPHEDKTVKRYSLNLRKEISPCISISEEWKRRAMLNKGEEKRKWNNWLIEHAPHSHCLWTQNTDRLMWIWHFSIVHWPLKPQVSGCTQVVFLSHKVTVSITVSKQRLLMGAVYCTSHQLSVFTAPC